MSVGRRVVEQAFGRLYQKFRIFGVAPSMNPERYVSIVKALLVVHNFLIDTSLDEENSKFVLTSLFQKFDKRSNINIFRDG